MTTALERAILLAVTRAFRAIASTWRITLRMPDDTLIPPERYPFEREIWAVRERDLLALVPIARLTNVITLIAEGKDGDRASFVAETLGSSVVRGSSIHDPESAAIRFCRSLRSFPGPGLLVVDGPVGPAGVAKPGIAALAGLSGRPVRGVAVDARPKITLFYLWSRMIVPLPFAKVVFAPSEGLRVASAERANVERATAEVTETLASCAVRATEGLSGMASMVRDEQQVAR